MNELVALAERLISYDTSKPDPIHEAAGFIKGWLEARGIEARQDWVRELPVTFAEVGPGEAPASSCTATSTSSPATRTSSRPGSRATG